MSKTFNRNRNALFDILLILSFRLSHLDSKGMNNIERMSSKMSSICFLFLTVQYGTSQKTIRYSKEYIFLTNNVSGASSC